MKNLIKVYAKAIAVFVVGVVGNAIVNLVNGSAPWPQTSQEWLQYVITTLGAALVALIIPNKITQKQIDKDPNVIGGTVVSDEYLNKQKADPAQPTLPNVVPPSERPTYQNPWR